MQSFDPEAHASCHPQHPSTGFPKLAPPKLQRHLSAFLDMDGCRLLTCITGDLPVLNAILKH